MKQTFLRLAATGAVAAGLVLAQAPAQTAPSGQTRSKNMEQRRTEWRTRMFDELNLTPAQREKAPAISRQEEVAMKPVRQQMRENREAMRTAIRSNNKAEIDRLATEAGQL